MSTINRYNHFLNRDYSMKWYMPQFYVPNFEAWDASLSGQQQKYNAAVAATQKYPKHLEWRSDLAGQYKQEVDKGLEDITQTYLNEGVQAGNRKLRDYSLNLNRQWNPGGLAYELEQEYADYAGSVKQISDYYEKNKAENSANRTYSLYKLNQSAHNPFKYDETTGMYSRSGLTPDLVPYVDIADEAFKVAKEIKESGRTDIIQMSPAWFEKVKTEGVTEQTVKDVTEALLQQPKYQQQMQVEKWLIDQNTTPEQKTAIEQQAKQSVLEASKKKEDLVNKLSTSKSEQDRKDLQSTLRNQGYYDGPIDGKLGKDTKKAIDAYKQDLANETTKQADATTYDSTVNQQMIGSYTQPLIKAFARQKIDKDLIFNKEWETRQKIAAQRQNTMDMYSAIMSLKNPEQSQYLTTPGLGSPMESLDKMKQQQEEVYSNSKDNFNQVAKLSGLVDIIGNGAPNRINEVTEARLKSGSAEEFAQRMKALGYNDKQTSGAWDFYNSPAASDLQRSYVTMQSAKEAVDGINKAKSSMILEYSKTPEGKTELANLRKEFGFKGSDQELATALTGGKSFVSTTPGSSSATISPVFFPVSTGTDYVDKGKSFINKMNNYYKKNNTSVPQSLRGYSFDAIKGAGADLKKLIFDDLRSGHTVGYTSEGSPTITFHEVGSDKKVDLSDVTLNESGFRFDVNAAGITYYLTGKTKDGKVVSSVVEAPQTHMNKFAQIAVDMKKEAKDGNDQYTDALSNQVYALATGGPRYQNAVEDALVLNDRNTRPLDEVVDIQNSSENTVRTFGTNAYVKGTEIGSPIKQGGNTYQKYKIYNPKTGSSAYMLTIKDVNGKYVPIKNSDNGYYYDTSQEAESFIWNKILMSQVPLSVSQQKVHQTNLDEETANALIIGAANNTLNNNE